MVRPITLFMPRLFARPVARRLLACALLSLLLASPGFAAKRPSKKPADKSSAKPPVEAAAPAPEVEPYVPVPVDPNLPSVISITPHSSSEERQVEALRQEDLRRTLAPRAEAWSRAFRTEGAPFARFLAESLHTLKTAIGRGSRNVCYPLSVATERLATALPEAPEGALERDVRTALARVARGARLCLEGRPTTAQTEIRTGAEVLLRAAEAISNWGR